MDHIEALTKSFRAYDVRGIYPEELHEAMVAAISRAFIAHTGASQIMIGRDARKMNPGLFEAAVLAANQEGIDVIDLGLITTDMLYFASGHLNLPGFSITASHNPANYSGVKMIKAGAIAVSRDTGLNDIRDRAIAFLKTEDRRRKTERTGKVEKIDLLPAYLDHVVGFIDPVAIKPVKVVVNTMFGVASNVVQGLAERLLLELVPLNFAIDGTFPKGPPNPMLAHLREETGALVTTSGAAFGAAWDGDADRVFFWDEAGHFIEGYYTGVLLAQSLLEKAQGKQEKALHCARLGWLFDKIVQDEGGISLECQTGHGFIKEMMRAENALFAEEMSGHYYFRENFYADNGMIPFVLVLEMLAKTGKTLGQLVGEYQQQMVISGEINFRVDDATAVVEKVRTHYRGQGKENTLDGITVEFPDWRFNVRPSNNEPLLRLNIEGRSADLVRSKTAEVEALIGGVRADE